MIILFVGIIIGWVGKTISYHRKEIRGFNLNTRDAIIMDGFRQYEETNGCKHPADPRIHQATLTVVK